MHLDQLNESQLRLRRGQKWSLYAPEVLPAWVADMDFEVAEPIRAALAERLANNDLGYPLAPARTSTRSCGTAQSSRPARSKKTFTVYSRPSHSSCTM